MSLFERFKESKEEGFREEFIRPLLIRMGFIGISNKHGVNEFGKDYVFSEIDAFGQIRHLVVQAKHEEKINQGKKVDDIITQVKQCFYVPYTLPVAPTDLRHVSAVYVFNSGEITDNAETMIRSALPREIASNSRFFGGHYLETLERSISHRNASEVRNRCEALLRQMYMNLTIWKSLLEGISNYDGSLASLTFDLRGGILVGIEQYLSEPILWKAVDYDAVLGVWQQAKQIQSIVTRHTTQRLLPEATTRLEMEMLAGLCTQAISNARSIIEASKSVLSSLPPVTV